MSEPCKEWLEYVARKAKERKQKQKEKNRAYYLENRERELKRRKVYYRKNRERELNRQKKRRQELKAKGLLIPKVRYPNLTDEQKRVRIRTLNYEWRRKNKKRHLKNQRNCYYRNREKILKKIREKYHKKKEKLTDLQQAQKEGKVL